MSKELVISATPHETRVALVEDGQLCEIYIEREKEFALVGSIYKGRVTRVLPGMQSAFVDIGLDGDAFLYVSDFLENLEDYDHIVTAVEGKVQKMEQQGGKVFASPAGGTLSAPSAPSMIEPPEVAPVAGSEAAAPPEPGSQNVTPAAPPRSMPPPASPMPPYQQRDRKQGGYGRDRGRGGRWGRRGGGGDRRPGRDLPPSKYASPRPYDSRPYEPPPADLQPVVLPGESLAKYKDRIPAAPAAPPAAAPAPTEGSAAQQQRPTPAADTVPEAVSPTLPESLYVAEVSASPAEPREVRSEQGVAQVGGHSPGESAFPIAPTPDAFGAEHLGAGKVTEPARFLPDEESAAPPAEADLSNDDVTALAEQLAEAKHEEAQAEAEANQLGGEEEEEDFPPTDVLGEPYELSEPQEEPIEAAGEAGPPGALEEEHGPEPPRPPGENEPHPVKARIEEQPRARFQRPMRRGGRHPGGRPPHRHIRQATPRRPQLISEMLKAGQEIIVQIAKEPLGKKGARITSHVALPGRFLVHMPTVDHIGVSRKIASAEERSRLRRLVAETKATFPGGFIVRTAAEGASDDEVRGDVEFLGRTWNEIRARSEQRRAPALLHRDLNLVERILRDYLSQDYTSIWIDNEEEFSKVVDFVGRFQPNLVGRVKLYTKEPPIFEEFGIQQELDKALRPKVWLKSGGYIVINHTEALVAIDVNTGKYVGRGSTRLEDTIVKTNVEAVKEIVRQIRLRDLGGIIVVDFIDMEERRNREKVMAALDQALQADRAPSKVLSFNEFGLVAITRKRTKQALERVLCQPCPYCTGSGMVKSIPTICYEIQAEARKMSGELDSQSLTLRVNPEIAKALKTRESALVEELEQATRKSVIIQADPTLHWEQYDIY